MEIVRIVVGELFTNCYIIKDKGESCIIDPGAQPERILENIEGRVKYIINTHGHIDHIGADLKIREKTQAKILIHPLDAPLLPIKPDILLEEGDVIDIGGINLKVLHTPGHTQGSISLLGEDFIITGDTLFRDGIGRTDLPGGSEEDIFKSLERLKKYLRKGMVIYPGHGDVATYEEIGFYKEY